jgi:polysaccharide export outer membrane protein
MSKPNFRSALAAGAIAATACAWSLPADAAPSATTTPAALTAAATRPDYRINPGDTVDVQVFQVPDLSKTVVVDTGGKILLPLIGQVDASGRTVDELTQKIAAELGDKYLKDPQVTVIVRDSNSQKVTVDGAVNEPGIYPLAGPTTLIQAVALAKGPDSKRADTHKVAVLRLENGSRVTHVYDLGKIRDGKAADPTVLPQDVVIVGNSSGKSFLATLVQLAPLAFLIP